MEADGGHADVLCLSAGQWRVRAVVLLDGRASGLPGPVGRKHRVVVPICGPCAGRHRVRGDAPRRPPETRRHFRRMYGSVVVCCSRLHEGVRGRRGPAVCDGAHRCVHYVHVLCPACYPAHALDTLRRGVSDGGKRYSKTSINSGLTLKSEHIFDGGHF